MHIFSIDTQNIWDTLQKTPGEKWISGFVPKDCPIEQFSWAGTFVGFI